MRKQRENGEEWSEWYPRTDGLHRIWTSDAGRKLVADVHDIFAEHPLLAPAAGVAMSEMAMSDGSGCGSGDEEVADAIQAAVVDNYTSAADMARSAAAAGRTFDVKVEGRLKITF